MIHFLTKIPERIIKLSFHLAVRFIERFHDMSTYDEKVRQLSMMERGTLGKDVADCLEKHNLRLVPGFESHDLKHVLLKYEMNPVDEIRMQAFMLGNGNITVVSIAIVIFGFVLLPHKWFQFYRDFKLGLVSKEIKNWDLTTYASFHTHALRLKVLGMKDKAQVRAAVLNKMSVVGSLVAMVSGGLGMLYCLPYLYSPIMEDIVGAGFPFVGGAVLFSAGLISFSIAGKNTHIVTANVNTEK